MRAIALKSQDRRSSLTSRRSQLPIHFCVNGKQFLSHEVLGDMRDRAAKHRPCAHVLGEGHIALSAFGPHVGAALGDEL